MWIINIFIFLSVLSVLIITHEFGHFIAARLSGIRVDKFSIGFGPVIFHRKGRQTEFLISLIPLGGYVKLAGEQREEVKGKDDEFLNKPVGLRAGVILAGPLFNYLFSFIIIWVLFISGIPSLDSVVGGVIPGTPAEEAGLKKNDRIVAINGEKIEDWAMMQRVIRKSSGEPLELTILRNGKKLTINVVPQMREVKDIFGKNRRVPLIGIKSAMVIKTIRCNPFVAFYRAGVRIFSLTWMIIEGLYYTIVGVVPLRESLAGPIEIFRMTSVAAQSGFKDLLNFVSLIGISLTIVNLFPIPVLDGGHLFFLLLEKIRGRPLGEKAEEVLTRIGMAIIGVLIFFVFYNDIMRIVAGH